MFKEKSRQYEAAMMLPQYGPVYKKEVAQQVSGATGNRVTSAMSQTLKNARAKKSACFERATSSGAVHVSNPGRLTHPVILFIALGQAA